MYVCAFSYPLNFLNLSNGVLRSCAHACATDESYVDGSTTTIFGPLGSGLCLGAKCRESRKKAHPAVSFGTLFQGRACRPSDGRGL